MKIFFLVFICFNILCSKAIAKSSMDKMKEAQKESEELGKKGSLKALDLGKSFNASALSPPNSQPFDPKKAKDDIAKQKEPKSEALELIQSETVRNNEKNNQGFHEDELFFQQSEAIVNAAKNSEKIEFENEISEYFIEKCRQSGDAYPRSLIRTLHVHVNHHPEESKQVKVCSGHEDKEKHFWKKDAKKAKAKQKKKFSEDQTIAWFGVRISGGSGFSDYSVKSEWTHVDDAEKCNKYKLKTKVVKAERWEESGEEWKHNDMALFKISKTPDCTLIEQRCLDPNRTKNINGKKVFRKCWKENLTYLYQPPKTNECDFLKKNACKQIEKKCIKNNASGCALWEMTFKCTSKIHRKYIQNKDNAYGMDAECWQTAYEPNNSFSDVTTKLAVFEAIKNELENSKEYDSSKVKIFPGKVFECGKSVSGKIMYDCCFSNSGLAVKAKLSKCNTDEIFLSKQREKEMCYYIGSYEKKFMGLWKSQDKHVFCCFGSKLSKVVQEEARKQLGIGWGKPKEPNCNGLAIDEISRLDFSKIDLSGVFDQVSPRNAEEVQKKLENFQKNLQNKKLKNPTTKDFKKKVKNEI